MLTLCLQCMTKVSASEHLPEVVQVRVTVYQRLCASVSRIIALFFSYLSIVVFEAMSKQTGVFSMLLKAWFQIVLLSNCFSVMEQSC